MTGDLSCEMLQGLSEWENLMKKIGLMTLDSRTYNYGGLLQEYALYKTIGQSGYEVELINYDVKSEWNTFSYKRGLKYLTLKKVACRIAGKLGIGDYGIKTALPIRSRDLFEEFREKHFLVSAGYNRGSREEMAGGYDCIVCGSDQIWNPSFNIPAFFLDFVPEDKGKVIYAASLGVSELSRTQRKVYGKFLRGLQHVSVREENAKKLIQPLASDKVEVVLDPTLLLKKEDWMEFIDAGLHEEHYVFCYFLGINEEKVKAACSFAKKHNLSIVSVPFEFNRFPAVDCFANETPMGPCDFLTYIYHAKFVLTDSFHASVFSIMFNKPFRVFGRTRKWAGMSGRIETLLKYIGKEEYMIAPCDLENMRYLETEQYDFSKIETARKNSIAWLKRAIEEG